MVSFHLVRARPFNELRCVRRKTLTRRVIPDPGEVGGEDMSEIRVYIAAPYPLRPDARRVAQALIESGIEVTARWLFEGVEDLNDTSARKDLADVARANLFVALNPASWGDVGTGGRHVEFGYAVALRKPVLLVGPRTHVFHWLSDIVQVDDERDLATAVRALARDHDTADLVERMPSVFD